MNISGEKLYKKIVLFLSLHIKRLNYRIDKASINKEKP